MLAEKTGEPGALDGSLASLNTTPT